MENLRELALFAGAGGGILGGHLLGWRTVAAVEIEDYPRRVLLQRQADGILPRFPIWDDVQTFDGLPWRGKVDVISGGFPCQDISCAGKGAGIDGDRSSMWSHMARIIGEVRPRYAFVENSPMLVGRGLARVISDLAEMGYDAKWGVLGAHHVAAPHKRDRIWIIATDSSFNGCDSGGSSEREHEIDSTQIRTAKEDQQQRGERVDRSSSSCGIVADSESRRHGKCGDSDFQEGCNSSSETQPTGSGADGQSNIPNTRNNGNEQRIGELRESEQTPPSGSDRRGNTQEHESGQWWAVEPELGRVAHRVANRVDRLKAIGNGQVSAVAELAWETLTNK